MAAGQVSRSARGFTLAEMMAAVAVIAVLAALGIEAARTSQKVSRVTGQARFIVQKLQTVRTQAVGQGASQGYFFGPNGAGAAGPDANQAFVFYKQNPTDPPSYVAGTDRVEAFRDRLPQVNNRSTVVVTGSGVAQPAPFQIGFDMNGQVTVTPAFGGPWPYCITVSDLLDPTILRYVILFNDGTTKVQRDETWCP